MTPKSPNRYPLRGLLTPRFWLGVAVSLLALYLAVRNVRWSRVGAALSNADAALLLLALGSVLLTTWAKGLRWRLLFYPRHLNLSVRDCVFGVLVGQLANNLLPARLGELVRAFLIGEKSNISKIFALATIVVETGLDSVMLFLLIGTLSLLMPIPSWLRHSSLAFSGVLILLLLVVILLASQRRRIALVVEGLIEERPALAFLRALERLAGASAELEALYERRVELQLWAWSVAIWILALTTNALTIRALRLDVSPLAPALLLVVLMMGAILPTSPLQIGVFDYLCVLALAVFGVEQDVALTYAILLHLIVYLPIVVGGVLGLWVQNYDLGALATVSGEQARDG